MFMIVPRPADADRAQTVVALVRRIGDHHEVVGADVEAARRRPLVEDAHHLEALAADAHHLADRIGAARLEQQLVRGVAQHDDVLPVLHFRAVEEAAGQKRDARAFGEELAGAEHDEVLGLLIAVEDPLLCARPDAGAELDVDELQRRRAVPRAPGRRRPSGSGASAGPRISAPPLKLPMPNRWTKIVLGPIAPSRSRSDWSKPRISAVIPTIDVMPMTTPSTVNPERILLLRTVSSAMTMTSANRPARIAIIRASRLRSDRGAPPASPDTNRRTAPRAR